MSAHFTLGELLSHLSAYLAGTTDFSAFREWVYSYYVSEGEKRVDEAMEAILPVLRPYLEWQEAVGDPRCRTRMERLYRLLSSATTAFAERTVFALEFDEVQRLTKKLRDGLITRPVYERKMAELSPGNYDVGRVMEWAASHLDRSEPLDEYFRCDGGVL